jgi:hypothetical protein
MSLSRFFKSARVGISVALMVLVIGVAGEVAWLALGLPGVHRTAVAPTADVGAGTPQATTLYDRSETISESYVDMPFVIPAILGLVVGFWWAFRRHPTGTAQ